MPGLDCVPPRRARDALREAEEDDARRERAVQSSLAMREQLLRNGWSEQEIEKQRRAIAQASRRNDLGSRNACTSGTVSVSTSI